jgi:hypothetical protein
MTCRDYWRPQAVPSWNQIMEWLREVQRIREIASDLAA